MKNYNDLVKNILQNGVDRPDRTGIGSRFITGASLKYDLADGFPMLTSRKVSFRIAFEETMMFLRGITDTTVLEEKNINIWKGNTSREFLDSMGLTALPVGSLGTGYSHAWRNYGGAVGMQDGIDQVTNLINGIKRDPTGRRHIITAWNPTQLSGTPLPPCHLMQMYTVDTKHNKLNSSFIMRSTDVYLGLPTNLMGYAFLNTVFAKILGYTPGELVYFGHDAHLYQNQIDVSNELVLREPKSLPRIQIKKELSNLYDVLSLNYGDIEIVGYDPHPPLAKVEMAI